MSNYCLGPYRRLTRKCLLIGAVVLGVAGGPAVSAAGLGFMIAGAAASAQETVRVRGVIERRDGTAYLVKDRDGSRLRLTLAANADVALSDIKQGSFNGVAALPQVDGRQRALEVHIFHEPKRGTGEGHGPCDLPPKGTMTNAAMEQIAATTDGHSIILTYKDGGKKIIVPWGT